MQQFLSRAYSIHGLPLIVESQSAILSDMLDARLSYFSVPNIGQHLNPLVLRFELGGENSSFSAPSESNLAVHYFEPKDQWLCWWSDLVTARADISGRHATIRIRSESISHMMLATHTPLTLCLAEYMKRIERYFVHTGCVCLEGKGVIMPGRSGRGKTTLTLSLVRTGFGFLSDDVIFLSRTAAAPNALAFPDEVDITDTTASFFPELEPFAGTQKPGWFKQQIQVPEVYGIRPTESCTPRLIVFPTVGKDLSSSFLEPTKREDAYAELKTNVIPTEPTSTQAHRDAISDLVQACDCYRIHLGADWIERAPELIREALAKAPR